MSKPKTSPSKCNSTRPGPADIFLTFLYLGCTSFGGPVAHIGYFRDLLVEKKAWLDEHEYADLVALCQFLPGPSSSQVGFGIGLIKGGYAGGLAAFAGFTLPSALIMAIVGFVLGYGGDAIPSSLLVGLKLVAVSVVGHAVMMMGKGLTPDWPRRWIAVLSGLAVLAAGHPLMTLAVILGGGMAGLMLKQKEPVSAPAGLPPQQSSLIWIAAAFGLLLVLPVATSLTASPLMALADGFYRSGMLVFGGGHVVLPLLKAEMVGADFVTETVFLAGYGAAQAIPGPLFTIAAFLGQATGLGPFGITGALVALIMIFLGSFMLMLGVMPWWGWLRSQHQIRHILNGVNAAVVGLLAAVLLNPIMMTAINGPTEAMIALVGFVILLRGWLPALVVVGLIVAATMVLTGLDIGL